MHLELSPEANLWKALAEAANTPEKANLSRLWQLAEAAIAQVPISLRLQVAGKAILQLAEVYAARANLLLTEWDQTHNRTSPPLTVEGLAELLIRICQN